MSTLLDNQLSFGHRIGVFILAEISAIPSSSINILLGYIAVRFLNLVDWPTLLYADPLSTVQLPFAKGRGVDED